MNPGDPVELRRVVAAAQALSPVKPRSKEHAVGLGLRPEHRVPVHGQHDLRLPGFKAGLANILAAMSTGPDAVGIDTALRDAAWAALLGAPAAVVPLRPPSPEDMLSDGHPIPAGADGRLRAVAIATVVVPPTMRVEDRVLLDGPVAGVARLTVLTRPGRPELAEDAWLQARWVSSTSALSAELERLHAYAAAASAEHPRLNRLVLLIGDTLDDALGPELIEALRAVAYAHGYRLAALRRPRAHRGNVLASLKSDPPNLLVVAARPEDGADAVVAAALAGPGHMRVIALHARDSPLPDMVADLREQLITEAGVGPALTLLAREPDPPVDPSATSPAVQALDKLVPPDQRADRRRHGKWGVFHLSSADGLWYTLDYPRSQHAGSVVKSYRKVNRQLVHEHDYDADGNVIEKHKGAEGAVIDWDELFGEG